jgi:hypothetical protein
LYASVQANAVTTTRAFGSVIGVPLLILLALLVAAVLAGIRLAATTDDERQILPVTGFTIGCSLVYTFGLGIIASRIMFHVFPAVLVLIGWVAAKLAANSRHTAGVATLAVSVAALGHIAHEMTSYGPYS